MLKLIKRLVRDASGASAIEYGVLIGGIAVVIVTVLRTINVDIQTTFFTIANKL